MGRTNFRLTSTVILVLCSLVVLAHPANAQLYRLTDLGHLPGGLDSSSAFDINEAGQVVGSSFASTGNRAFLWDDVSGMLDLGDLPGGNDNSGATAINDVGQIVGISTAEPLNNDSTGEVAFLWDATSGMQNIGVLPGGDDYSRANDINNLGQVVGLSGDFSSDRSSDQAFLWDSTNGMQLLGTLPGGTQYSHANAINDAGQVVGVASTSEPGGAFIWDSINGMQNMGVLPEYSDHEWLEAYDINELGQAVGWSRTTNEFRAFIWDSTNGMQDLGEMQGWAGVDRSYRARGINDLGQVVGFSSGATTGSIPFLWDSTSGMIDLNTLLDSSGDGYVLKSAFSINNSGQIVGTAIFPDVSERYERAILLTPVPEPSSIALGSVALLAFLGFARRRYYSE